VESEKAERLGIYEWLIEFIRLIKLMIRPGALAIVADTGQEANACAVWADSAGRRQRPNHLYSLFNNLNPISLQRHHL